MYEFSGLGHTIESRLTGTVFKILDTRQSEILIEFSRNIPFNSPKNSRDSIVCPSPENSYITKRKHHLESLGISEQRSNTLERFQ